MNDLTVGIPFYSESLVEELKIAIDSIMSQTIRPDEIHLIQDGPVSAEISEAIKQYLKKGDNLKHLMIPERNGLSCVLNISILNSKTTFYARMDSDDISHPQRLEKQISFLQDNPHIDILGTWALEFEEDINNPANVIRKTPVAQEEIYRLFHYRNPLNHPTIMFRRKIFAEIGLYNPSFTKAQDTELYARAFKKRIGVSNLPEVLYYLRAKNIINKRTTKEHIKYQFLGRYKYNTWSIKLNVLKIFSIIFRFMPKKIQRFVYDKYMW